MCWRNAYVSYYCYRHRTHHYHTIGRIIVAIGVTAIAIAANVIIIIIAINSTIAITGIG